MQKYVHPLSERYASPDMQAVFSPARRYGTWRRLWLALAENQKALGLEIPDEAIRQIREALDDIDFERARELEARFRHDVMAHVHLLGEAAPAAKGVIHLGATSAYVTDNTDLILHRDALELIQARIVRVVRALATFAREHRDLATLGFTHFQPAQPTTVGRRAALWIQDFLLDLEDVEFRLDTLRFRGARGTTGTQASFLQLFDGDGEKVEKLDRGVADTMGFLDRFGVTGQTYPRKVDATLLGTLSGVAISASKFGHDLRLLAHLREVEEPFEDEQIGSSAMPYKRNPMRAERICGLARHVITLYQDPAVTAATQWMERTLDDSANRRVSIPDAYLALDGVLVLVENVARDLVVHPKVVAQNLRRELPFMATESILMEAVGRGMAGGDEGRGDRQELHERIRRHSFAAVRRLKEEGGENDLLDRIAKDPAFGMERSELESLVDPERFVGRAREQVDRFLSEWVEPALARHPDEDGDLLGDPDVRV